MSHATLLFRAVPLMAIGLLPLAAPASAAGDAAAGKKAFLQCQMCHSVESGGRDGIGPNLSGIIGKKAASRPGFKYSEALKKSQITWNAASLDPWLKKPSATVPGTRMIYAGMNDAAARANVIAYLATLRAK
ncbi:cytochrome c family protein [Sphingobium sp. SCG-1]|uniref:c-type cytochrome n=1 Tax=Sphingobium sp. SCG-1 TaxID=2072936 RepID=UPI000CD6B050|nr:c-type cytochrome [Sphingobium sp. SCG-1]AUW58533.1 cytochrome c family protein [Sphingobium sp. SCG-1]